MKISIISLTSMMRLPLEYKTTYTYCKVILILNVHPSTTSSIPIQTCRLLCQGKVSWLLKIGFLVPG